MLLPAVPESVSRIRRAVADLKLDPPLLDTVRLLVTELVTNSIRHSGIRPDECIRVTASWSGTRLRIVVQDRRTAAPSSVAGTIRPAPGAESGWGLYLVDRLASRWGTASGEEAGYWFELEAAGRRAN
jgi:anti-sigma regulatory factor (Ser/Thr protein kinase)